MIPFKKRHVKFLSVGLVNTSVDIGIYTILVALSMSPIVANYVSTSCGMFVSYNLHKRYTFDFRGPSKRHGIMLFVLVTLAGLWVIQPLAIYALVPLFARLPRMFPSL